MYSGQILPDHVTIIGKFTKAMKDLSMLTFCVPVLDRLSPVAFSVVNDIHWNDFTAKHAGIETTSRFVLKKNT